MAGAQRPADIMLLDSGKKHPAACTRPSRMTIAPSCRGSFEEDIADQLGGRTGIHQRTGRYNIPQTGTALYDDQRTGAFLGKYGAAITDGINAAHHIAVILKAVSADAVHCLSDLCQREAGTPQLFQYLSQLRLEDDKQCENAVGDQIRMMALTARSWNAWDSTYTRIIPSTP